MRRVRFWPSTVFGKAIDANAVVVRVLSLCVLIGAPASSMADNHSDSDYPPEFAPVVQAFSGLSYADHAMIRDSMTPDFLLLEVGEVWDLEYLLSVVTPSERQRNNYFHIISVERFDGVALINYWNKATFEWQDGASVRTWLESVVAVETPSGWKLKQMHSTRIEPDQLPEDIELSLHMLPSP